MLRDERAEIDAVQLTVFDKDAPVDDRKRNARRRTGEQRRYRIAATARMRQVVDAKCDDIGGHAGLQRADIFAAKHARATERGEFERLARGEAIGARLEAGPAHALQEHRLPRLAEEMIPVVARRTIDAKSDPDTCIDHRTHRRDAGREDHVAGRTVADARVRVREARNFVRVRMHHVREPHVVAHPLDRFRVFERALAELR
jgi:hypothetical protein